ncbi:MAG: HAMP domain-containing protein [Deltaproteobacteria bacterium]|nr:HAMP domain-containing protein [Deltaproteobacteria bacterium]
MAFSIRTRLTFWYVTLLTLSLIVFSAAFSYSVYRISINRIDGQIASVAEMMVHTIVKPSGEFFLPRDFDIILGRFFGIRTAGHYIQLLDAKGAIVARSSSLEGRYNMPLSKEAYAEALKGVQTYENVKGARRFPIRVVTKPIIFKGARLVAIVQVGSSLEGMEDIFHSLALILGLGVVAVVITASVFGALLARKALKPVAQITAQARKITAENLNERLEVRVSQDEIGSLAVTINEMIERLEASFNRIRQFTADASHELKTPLTILKGEMEMALRSKDDVQYMQTVIASSLEEIDRMSYIVRNLLDLARLDADKEALERQPVKLDEILAGRYEHLQRFALDSRVELVMLNNAPCTVMGDAVRIGQLFYNLIDNAIKYSPEGARVEISLDAEARQAVVRIRDTGIGIAKEDLPYIFDRFYRVDKARTTALGGAGLGLSICKEIVESLGGSIEAQSEAGKGTLFIVRLALMDNSFSSPLY